MSLHEHTVRSVLPSDQLHCLEGLALAMPCKLAATLSLVPNSHHWNSPPVEPLKTMKPRHIYSLPVSSPAGAFSSVLRAPLAHRPPNLLPVEYEGVEMYQLWEDYTYLQLCADGVYRPRTEPKGRLVDGASVPRPAWAFMPPDGRHRRPCFLHDLDYALGLLPKRLADLEFRRRMLEDGVSRARTFIAYNAVKSFGDPRKSVARWSELLYSETP